MARRERKGFVRRERSARAHRYAAADTRDAAVAEAMMAALETTSDRDSALVRFVGSVTPAEADIIRKALATQLDADADADAAIEGATDADTGADPAQPVADSATAATTPRSIDGGAGDGGTVFRS
jgi:hypothetical protein